MLPPIFRTFFAKRKPAPQRCTDQNINELLGRIISHDNTSRNLPETVRGTWARDNMPDRYRRAEGEQE